VDLTDEDAVRTDIKIAGNACYLYTLGMTYTDNAKQLGVKLWMAKK